MADISDLTEEPVYKKKTRAEVERSLRRRLERADHQAHPRSTATELKRVVEGLDNQISIHPMVSQVLESEEIVEERPPLATDATAAARQELKGDLETALQDPDTAPPDHTPPPPPDPTNEQNEQNEQNGKSLIPTTDLGSDMELWGIQQPPPLVLGEDTREELLMHAIFQLRLRGYSPDSISRKIGLGYRRTRRYIKKIEQRTLEYLRQNPAVLGAPVEILYQQVLRRRDRQSALWEEIETTDRDTLKPQYYRLIAEEDKHIEGLLGLNQETIKVLLGSPMEDAGAEILKQMGPDGLRDLLSTIRTVYQDSTGMAPTTASTQVIEGTIREFKSAQEET